MQIARPTHSCRINVVRTVHATRPRITYTLHSVAYSVQYAAVIVVHPREIPPPPSWVTIYTPPPFVPFKNVFQCFIM